MKNTSSNAIIRMGDLHPQHFIQGEDGIINVNTDYDLPADRAIVYMPNNHGDTYIGNEALLDASNGVPVWEIPVNNLYSATGVNVGSAFNFNMPDLG